MAISQVELCNLALSRAGGQRISQITSLGEASNEARQCAIKLPHLIRTNLRSYPWRFATKKIALAQIVPTAFNEINDPYLSALAKLGLPQTQGDQETHRQQKNKAFYGSLTLYQYPEDCLLIRALYSATHGNVAPMADASGNNPSARSTFTVEIAQDGTRLILSPFQDAILIYTAYMSDPTIWDALFYDAMAWQLGAELCISLGNDLQKAQALENNALRIFDKAKSMDSKEDGGVGFYSSYLLARH